MTDSTYFSLEKESEIFIYGAGGLGQTRASCLQHTGYQVKGFIDKNADNCSRVMGLPVYLPQDIAVNSASLKDKIIIVCLHNALWHQKVAAMLHDMGCEKILFLPVGNQYVAQLRRCMEKMYDYMTDELYNHLTHIPVYSALTKVSLSIEDGVIEKTDTTVTVWMHITSIFTNELLKQRGNEITQNYGDISIAALKPYIELFEYCKYGTGNIDLYCKVFKEVQNKTDVYSSHEFIRDRIELYERLRLELNQGMEYFIQAAPLLKWSDKSHHFNVREGHHRLVFLLLEGLNFIPVKISQADFQIWKHSSVYQKCADYLQKHKMAQWFTPLNHPGFYFLSAEKENVSPCILAEFQKRLGIRSIDNFTAADYSGLGGYFARALKSMHCSHVVCHEENSERAAFIRLLNQLFYQEDILVYEDALPSVIADMPLVNIAFFSFSDISEDKLLTYWKQIKYKVSDYMVIELSASETFPAFLSENPFPYVGRLKRVASTVGLTDIWLLSKETLED